MKRRWTESSSYMRFSLGLRGEVAPQKAVCFLKSQSHDWQGKLLEESDLLQKKERPKR